MRRRVDLGVVGAVQDVLAVTVRLPVGLQDIQAVLAHQAEADRRDLTLAGDDDRGTAAAATAAGRQEVDERVGVGPAQRGPDLAGRGRGRQGGARPRPGQRGEHPLPQVVRERQLRPLAETAQQ